MPAKAEKAQDLKDGCPICLNDDVPLPHFDNKLKLKICDECWTKAHQKSLPLDEYDLQPDELTKEQFAEKAGVSIRNIEIWKASGKLPSEKIRRRINGTVRKTTIFKVADVEKFLAGENIKVNFPNVEKTKTTEQSEENINSQAFAFNFMEGMNQLAQMMQTKKSILTELSGKIFIGIDELAQFTGIAKSRLEIAIKEAEEKEVLRHFTGERGKSVYRCDELDLLIENLPPTPKQLPPRRKEI